MGRRVLTAYERALEEGELRNKIEIARKMSDEKGFSFSEVQELI